MLSRAHRPGVPPWRRRISHRASSHAALTLRSFLFPLALFFLISVNFNLYRIHIATHIIFDVCFKSGSNRLSFFYSPINNHSINR